MKHKAVRIKNLIYNGCPPCWGCINCGAILPVRRYSRGYSKEQFENIDCCEEDIEEWKDEKNRAWAIPKRVKN